MVWRQVGVIHVCLLAVGEGSAFLSFKKGDLIRLDNEDGQDVMQSGWCSGICERTGEQGDFPAECVYVLPAITRPPPEVLVCHRHSHLPLDSVTIPLVLFVSGSLC